MRNARPRFGRSRPSALKLPRLSFEILESRTLPSADEWMVVFSGIGFSENSKSFLIASGRAVELDELGPRLQLFFGLELPPTPERPPLRLRTPVPKL